MYCSVRTCCIALCRRHIAGHDAARRERFPVPLVSTATLSTTIAMPLDPLCSLS